MKKIKNWDMKDTVILIVLIIAIWVPRGMAVGRFATGGENKWLARSGQFFAAFQQKRFSETYIVVHPGVINLWAGAAAYSIHFPESKNSDIDDFSSAGLVNFLRENDVEPLAIFESARHFGILASVVAISAAYYFLKNLIGRTPAVLGLVLIAFNPYHIAFTRLIKSDGLLSSFILLSLVAGLHYILKGGSRISLVVSAVAAGLSWLSKSPGFFLIAYMGMLFLIRLLNNSSISNSPVAQIRPGKLVIAFIVWAAVGIATYILLWPAMWTDPLGTISKVLGGASDYSISGHSLPVFFSGEIITDGKIGWDNFPLYYPTVFIWRNTPVSLIGIAIASFFWIRPSGPFAKQEVRESVFFLTLFSLLYTVFMTFGLKKGQHYLLPIFPVMDIVAGLGWFALISWIVRMTSGKLRTNIPVVLIVLLAFTQLLSAASVYPYYLNYFNPLLGGIHKAQGVLQIGLGEGLDEAGRYLNSKPNADQLLVSSWYQHGSLSYFFDGDVRAITGNGGIGQVRDADYAVIYFHQWQRQLPKRLLELLQKSEPEHRIWIDGFEFVQIYNMESVFPEE